MSEQQVKKNKGGRPRKTGLKHFPVDHNLFDHKKLRQAEDLVDPQGDNALRRLLVDKMLIRFYSFVYKVGYYREWNEEAEIDLCKAIGNGMNRVFLAPFLKAFLDTDLLSKEMFERHSIITSGGIQEKWLEISKMIRRDNPKIEEQYYIPPKPEFIPEETLVSSRRNKGKHPNKHNNTHQNGHSGSENAANKRLVREETPVSSVTNPGILPNQQGVSPSTTTIVKSILSSTIVEEENKFPPEESTVTSGGNANNSIVDDEKTQKPTNNFSKQHGLLPEETIVISEKTYHKILSSSLETYPLDVCLANYLYNPAYSKTREQHQINWGVIWDIETLKAWGEAFNRSKLSDGFMECQFNGSGGWLRNLRNWMPKVGDYKAIDPTLLYTKHDLKLNTDGNKRQTSGPAAHSGNAGSAGKSKVGGIPADKVDELLNRKRGTGNT